MKEDIVDAVLHLHDKWRAMYQRERTLGLTNHICTEWRGSRGKSAFVHWALANGYEGSLYLDRINNKEGYSPSNCQWITAKENGVLSYAGRFWTQSELCESGHCHSSITRQALYGRLKSGWSLEDAITIPVSHGNRWLGKGKKNENTVSVNNH